MVRECYILCPCVYGLQQVAYETELLGTSSAVIAGAQLIG